MMVTLKNLRDALAEQAGLVTENDDQQVTISLATARTNQELKDPAGLSIYGISCTVYSLDGTITIRFDVPPDSQHLGWAVQALTWPQMIQFNRYFNKIFVTNAAQPGKNCILYVGKHT